LNLPIVEVGFAGLRLTAGASASDALVAIGPTVQVEIGFDPATYTALSGAPPPVMLPTGTMATPPQIVPALIDTGAQQSMIDEDLAVQLALPLINRQPVSGVSGQHIANVYLAHLLIPTLGGQGQFGAFMGAHLQAGGQPHGALLGRTLLRRTLLIYDGERGSVRLSI
jgi:hypothetical protein